jgi:signal transduction histidine kinase
MTLAELAGQLTHELANSLGAIAMQGESMKLERPGDPWLEERLDPILDSARDAVGLLELLREMGRRQASGSRTTDLNLAIEELLPALESLCGEGIRLEVSLDDELAPVAAERPHLEHLLLSLVLHARSALCSAQGTLRLRTHRSPAAGGTGTFARLEAALLPPAGAIERPMGQLLLPCATAVCGALAEAPGA